MNVSNTCNSKFETFSLCSSIIFLNSLMVRKSCTAISLCPVEYILYVQGGYLSTLVYYAVFDTTLVDAPSNLRYMLVFFFFTDVPKIYNKCYSAFRVFYAIGVSVATVAVFWNASVGSRSDLVAMLFEDNSVTFLHCDLFSLCLWRVLHIFWLHNISSSSNDMGIPLCIIPLLFWVTMFHALHYYHVVQPWLLAVPMEFD